MKKWQPLKTLIDLENQYFLKIQTPSEPHGNFGSDGVWIFKKYWFSSIENRFFRNFISAEFCSSHTPGSGNTWDNYDVTPGRHHGGLDEAAWRAACLASCLTSQDSMTNEPHQLSGIAGMMWIEPELNYRTDIP